MKNDWVVKLIEQMAKRDPLAWNLGIPLGLIIPPIEAKPEGVSNE